MSFKDTVKNKEDKKALAEEQARVAAEKKAQKIQEEKEAQQKFSDQLKVDEAKRQIKEEIQLEWTQKLEEGLRAEIEESVRAEVAQNVEKQLRKELTEQMDTRIVDATAKLVAVIEQLSAKVEKLNEGLNIEVPTPVVQMVMPKIKRKVIRNEQGLVESIEESYEDED